MFVAHLVATIILNRKYFDFFVPDKPFPRYHVAHPSTSNLWCFFLHFLTLFIKPNNFHIHIFHSILTKNLKNTLFF